MAGTLIHVTKAGRAALVATGNTGTAAHKITAIGVSTVAFDDTDETLTILPGERKRISTISGENVAADTIHVTLKDDTTDQYSLYGLGLYLENGVLFAVYSQRSDVGPIMEKSPAAMLLLAADMQFTKINAAQLYFGDATFTNPPATTERQGVVELATNAESLAGIDTQRAVTPAGLQSALTPALATKANVAHRHAMIDVDGLQSALDAKLNLTGGIVRGDTTLADATLVLRNGSYASNMRADVGGFVGFINQAVTAWNLQLSDAGVLSLPRARPKWLNDLIPWDNGNFDPNTRVVKTGDRMSGDLYIDSGGLHLSGWNGNPNSGVVFLNASGTKYVHFDGTNYSLPGADIYTGPSGSRVWHAGNFNPANYIPTTGGNVNGQLGILNSNTLMLGANNGYSATLRSDAGGFVGFINQAANTWNMQLSDAGRAMFRGQVWAANGGGRLCEDGNIYGAVWGDYLSNWLNARFAERDTNINSRAPKRNGNPNSGYVGSDTGNSVIINWDGNFRIFVDGQYGSALWGTHNFDPGSKLTRGGRNSSTGTYLTSASPPGISGISASGNGDNVALTIANEANQSASAVIQFHREGSFAAYFGLDTDNQWAVGGRSMGNVRYRIWHEGNFNPNSYAPIRNGANANGGYVVTDTGNRITFNWTGSTQFYIDNSYQGDLIHSNNYINWCAPRSVMDYGGIGSYTYMNTGGNPGINTLVNLPGMGGTWRVMSGGYGANGKDILYVRIG